jgi:hypothetical protein
MAYGPVAKRMGVSESMKLRLSASRPLSSFGYVLKATDARLQPNKNGEWLLRNSRLKSNSNEQPIQWEILVKLFFGRYNDHDGNPLRKCGR